MGNPVVDMTALFTRLLESRPQTNAEQNANVRQYEKNSRDMSFLRKREYSAAYMQKYKQMKQAANTSAVTAKVLAGQGGDNV